MARNWTLSFEPRALDCNSPSVGASPDVLPTTLRPSVAFDAATDESAVAEWVMPFEHTGSGTIKARIFYAGNTTTAADDVRWDIVGEALTPDNSENANSDSYGATADSGTGTFSTTAYSLESITITLTNFKADEAPAAGDKCRLKLTRDANHATDDSLAVDCHVVGVEVYEEV